MTTSLPLYAFLFLPPPPTPLSGGEAVPSHWHRMQACEAAAAFGTIYSSSCSDSSSDSSSPVVVVAYCCT